MQVNIGEVFNRLTVLEKPHTLKSRKVVKCKCACGEVKTVRVDGLKAGTTGSCGCYRVDQLRNKICTHKMTNTPTYQIWEAMLQRCNNPNASNYNSYGGRGIKVCESWVGEHGFINFLNDVGERPNSFSLDRIDVNGHYKKANCRWADASLQGFNTRISSNNTSGRTGVSWDKGKSKWAAYIMKDRKKINLGRYLNLTDAVNAREQGELKYY